MLGCGHYFKVLATNPQARLRVRRGLPIDSSQKRRQTATTTPTTTTTFASHGRKRGRIWPLTPAVDCWRRRGVAEGEQEEPIDGKTTPVKPRVDKTTLWTRWWKERERERRAEMQTRKRQRSAGGRSEASTDGTGTLDDGDTRGHAGLQSTPFPFQDAGERERVTF